VAKFVIPTEAKSVAKFVIPTEAKQRGKICHPDRSEAAWQNLSSRPKRSEAEGSAFPQFMLVP
jgi:hypothetical protein